MSLPIRRPIGLIGRVRDSSAMSQDREDALVMPMSDEAGDFIRCRRIVDQVTHLHTLIPILRECDVVRTGHDELATGLQHGQGSRRRIIGAMRAQEGALGVRTDWATRLEDEPTGRMGGRPPDIGL